MVNAWSKGILKRTKDGAKISILGASRQDEMGGELKQFKLGFIEFEETIRQMSGNTSTWKYKTRIL